MSRMTALGIIPGRRPVELAEYGNAHGWAPSIWTRLLVHLGLAETWRDESALDQLWGAIEELPEWQQIPLVLTFDTGVIPFQAYAEAVDALDEFERRCPRPDMAINHVPAVADLLRSGGPEAPLFGVWGTSVTDNPFDPWDHEADEPGTGIPLAEMYLLPQHRHLVPDHPLVKATGGAS